LSKLLRTIELVGKRLNPELTLSNVIYCMFDTGTRLANEVVDDVEMFFEDAREANFFSIRPTQTAPKTTAAWLLK